MTASDNRAMTTNMDMLNAVIIYYMLNGQLHSAWNNWTNADILQRWKRLLQQWHSNGNG